MKFEDSEIKPVALEIVAEFGENAEQELRARCDLAKARGMAITECTWKQILQCVEKMRGE